MAFQLDRFDHVVLTVASIEAAEDFYTEVLGMEIVLREGRHALAFGVQKINLHQKGHEFQPHASHPMAGSADLCFVTEASMDEVVEYLKALRVHLELGPIEREGALGKMQSVYIRDPDRNLIEISKYL